MRNSLILIIMSFVTIVNAQKQKGDTLVLSVYNNNSRYMLTLADFGPDELTQSIVGEMIAVYDTVITIKGKADSTKNKEPRFTVTRTCDKPLGDVRDKIVIMSLNKDCDVTLLSLNVQKAGAKAFVIVHNSNSNGNIKLPKRGVYKDSVRIPVFTIRQSLGERIMSMLPSVAGISLRRVNAQNLMVRTDSESPALQEKSLQKGENNEAESNDYLEVTVFPNPATDVLNIELKGYGEQPIEVLVMDMQGKLIVQRHWQNSSEASISLPLSNVQQSGQYAVLIKSSGKRDIMRLFQVSR